MAHILKNRNLEVHIDFPLEKYNFSRFDWTGKIASVKFQNMLVSGVERMDPENEHLLGKGYYNEFGMDTALGFEEAKVGDWFHKIGVGLLKKDDEKYLFSKKYEIKPAKFTITSEKNRVSIHCESQAIRGYSYILKKEIELEESGFTIQYCLQNTGEKEIVTDEYVHNFIAINKDWIGSNYVLKFPFQLKPELFGETVNPERKVDVGQKEITFNGSPEEQFFFSNLSGNEAVAAEWELINMDRKIGIRETGSFQTHKVNLWGWRHVISPELFFRVAVSPGQSREWSRSYHFFKVK